MSISLRCSGLLVLLILVLLPFHSGATMTWRVPSEHPTICGSVDSAAYGDTVLVAPGTYEREVPENSTPWIIMKDGITLISETGPEETTLLDDAIMGASTIYCDSIVDARVIGFTIRNSDVGCCYPRAIAIAVSKVYVAQNVICGFYSGISLYGEPPYPEEPFIFSNKIHNCSVGIDLWWSADSPRIVDNHIYYCWSDGIWSWNSSPYIDGNTIEHNGLNGLCFEGYSNSLMIRNKICYNGGNGVAAIMEDGYNHPCLNFTWRMDMANDVFGNGGYAVYFTEPTGLGCFEAIYNYWGTLCPQPSSFYGSIAWTPWVDSTHTTLCYDCPATSPTTWSSIKAIFK